MDMFLCLEECDQAERFRHGVCFWHDHELPRKGGVLELQNQVTRGGGELGLLVEAYWFDMGDIENPQDEEYWGTELRGRRILPNDVAIACIIRFRVYNGFRTFYEEVR